MPCHPFAVSSPAARVLQLWLLAAGVVASTSPAVWAQEPEGQPAAVATGSRPLETSITVETLQVEKAPGDRDIPHWVPAGRLVAGDELYYTVRVRNPGKEPVSDVVVTKRLPFGVRYRIGSATGPACDVQFSSDGVTFSSPGASAGTTKKSARKPAAEYTHVRWVFQKPLSPNATALLRFRATFS